MNLSRSKSTNFITQLSQPLVLNFDDAYKHVFWPDAIKVAKITKCPSLHEAKKLLISHCLQKQYERGLMFIFMDVKSSFHEIQQFKQDFENSFLKPKLVVVLDSGSDCAILWKLKEMGVYYCLNIVKTEMMNTFDFICEFIYRSVADKHNGKLTCFTFDLKYHK